MTRTRVRPDQVADELTHADFAAANIDGGAAVPSLRTLGTGAAQAAPGNTTAPLASPTFSGVPSGPTAANGTNTTQFATTAFVLAQYAAGVSGGRAIVGGTTGHTLDLSANNSLLLAGTGIKIGLTGTLEAYNANVLAWSIDITGLAHFPTYVVTPTIVGDEDVGSHLALTAFHTDRLAGTVLKVFQGGDLSGFNLGTETWRINIDGIYETVSAASGTSLKLVACIDTATVLHVKLTGNDTTGKGTSGLPWLTTAKALTYLADKYLTADVEIRHGDGAFAITTALDASHPQWDRITISGTNTYAKTISSVVSSSGSAGAYSYNLQLDSSSDIAVGDYAIIRTPTAGSNPLRLRSGPWLVTGINSGGANRVTITVTQREAAAASGAVTGTLTVVKSRITCTACNGITVLAGSGLGHLTKIVLVGDGTNNGILCNPGSSVKVADDSGITAFDVGINATACAVIFNGNISNCDVTGLSAETDCRVTVTTHGCISGCASHAYIVSNNSTLYGNNHSIGNGGIGFYCAASAHVNPGNGNVFGNQSYGLLADTNAFIYGNSLVIANNGAVSNITPDVYAPDGSFISRGGTIRYPGVSILNRVVSAVTFDTTAAEQTLYSFSIPAGLLSTDKAVRLTLFGTFLANSGTPNFTYRVKYGATTMWADVTANHTAGATRGAWRIELILAAQNATNSQVVNGYIQHGRAVAASTGVGDIGAITSPEHASGPFQGTATEDSTAAKTLAVTAQMSVSNVADQIVCNGAVLEYLGA